MSRAIHGEAFRGNKTPTYRSWRAMKTRCLNPNHHYYWRYGGRGITICQRWIVFENFFSDMGHRPDGMTLERINNDGNYEPSNCKWADRKTQSENSINTVWIEFDGQKNSISEWGRITGLGHDTLWRRLNSNGWTIKRALTEPKEKRTKRAMV